MSDSLQANAADRAQTSRRPIRFLTIACLITAVVMLLSVWSAYDSYRKFGVVSQRGLRIQELRGQILLFDEILTMSARMSAATGDPRWETRYRKFEPELSRAIGEAKALVPDLEMTGQTDASNDALVALEERVFQLVREARLGEAQAILSSEQYAQHKTAYAEGMEALGRQLENVAVSAARSLQKRAVIQLTGSLIALPLLVAGWLVVLRITARWRRDIAESHERLVQLNRNLDQKVVERTAELQRATQEAHTANQAKSAFLANMSHELRTPMNAIIGYSEMLVEDAEDEGNEEVAGDLKKIHSAGNHLLALINDVLDLSKIEAGKMDLFLETFEIPRMIEDVVATVDALVKKNDNRLRLELDDTLGEARADVTKVRQALFNLLSNAAKFTRGDEIALVVQGERDGGVEWLRMSVSDSGIGIPPEKLDHVFEEFSQADESTSRNYGGTGLGLPISKRFCQMMGGDITVESRVGEGSTFTIRIPARVEVDSEAAEVEDAPLAVTPEPAKERTVLVIDDDPNALDILGRTLQGAGVRVVTASDGREALRLARTLRPAAITLDVMMPDMDGWEVLSELKADAATCDIPVIMVTMTDDRALGYALGATEFLTKPVQRSQLVQLLDRYAPGDSERHALVVDDRAENREMLRRALEIEGWRVSEADNGRTALDALAVGEPSLILLDLMMPVMDGFEFVLEMRKRDASRAIPIVVVTAKDITDEDRRRLSGGVVGLIEKSGLDRESLLTQLRELVAAAVPGDA